MSNRVLNTSKNLCQSLFFNKIAGLGPATLLKKRLWHRCFPVNFAKFLRTPFFIEHPWFNFRNQLRRALLDELFLQKSDVTLKNKMYTKVLLTLSENL